MKPLIEIFQRFAADFELAVEDNDWSRLESYLAGDATYVNVGDPDSFRKGREGVIDFLREDVQNSDRRFDSRTHIELTPPTVSGDRLSRRWRCTYTLSGAPDLVVEGEARYRFKDGLIVSIEEELTEPSMQTLEIWMRSHGARLHP